MQGIKVSKQNILCLGKISGSFLGVCKASAADRTVPTCAFSSKPLIVTVSFFFPVMASARCVGPAFVLYTFSTASENISGLVLEGRDGRFLPM